VPANALYFMLYERTKKQMDKLYAPAAPAIGGLVARTVAVFVTSPLELVRTYMQSHAKPPSGQRGVWGLLRDQVRTGGVVNLWIGLSATLSRDVPFSVIYWSAYELIKSNMSPHANGFLLHFASGAGAGLLAAGVTTPIDVVKTRRQMYLDASHPHYPTRMSDIYTTIVAEEGVRGLFKGFVPRVAKVAPSCAIMVASYEFFKQIV